MGKMSISTPIRTLYTANSFLSMSFYNTCFSIRVGGYNRASRQYDNSNAQTMTIYYDGASFFYYTAMSIIDGKYSENELEAVYSRGSDRLILDYKREHDIPNALLIAHLVLQKNGQSHPFKFMLHPCKVKIDGQIVTKFIQSGLGVFAATLNGYLSGVGADIHLNKLPEEHDCFQEEAQQEGYATINGREYQKEKLW